MHAGPAIVGNFGGGRFFDYTAYGDTINIAARLEAANKQLGTRICVSAAARQRAGFPRPAGRRPRPAAEPSRCAPSSRCRRTATRRRNLLEAFAMLEAGTPAPSPPLPPVGKRPEDRLASFHLKRLLNGAKGTRIAMD